MTRVQRAVEKRRRRAARKDASNYAKKNLFHREFPTSTAKGQSWQVTRAIGNLVTFRWLQRRLRKLVGRPQGGLPADTLTREQKVALEAIYREVMPEALG